MGDAELSRLQQEVVRLSQELDQTVAEKEQAAQYGLVLLEEKDGLEARCQVTRTEKIIMHYFFLRISSKVDWMGLI